MKPLISVSVLAAATSIIARTIGIRNIANAVEGGLAATEDASGIEDRALNAIALDINVYFHVIYESDSIKDGNVLISQLTQQIEVLNTDFTNASLTFNMTEITRTKNANWFDIDFEGSAQKEMKETLRKGGPGDLNVYIVRNIVKKYGYSTFPSDYSSNPKVDGVVIRSNTLPGGTEKNRNDGRILTHEVGHWVGLNHIFDNGCSGDDQVADTPQLADKTRGCPTEVITCSGQKDSGIIHNFMGLSDCMSEFTDGQIKRLREQISEYRGLSFKIFKYTPPSIVQSN